MLILQFLWPTLNCFTILKDLKKIFKPNAYKNTNYRNYSKEIFCTFSQQCHTILAFLLFKSPLSRLDLRVCCFFSSFLLFNSPLLRGDLGVCCFFSSFLLLKSPLLRGDLGVCCFFLSFLLLKSPLSRGDLGVCRISSQMSYTFEM